VRIAEPAVRPDLTIFRWFRQATGQALAGFHRTHFAATCDDCPDVSPYDEPFSDAPSISLTAPLMGQMIAAGQEADRARAQAFPPRGP
jgi:hypothetical protein